MAPVVPEPVIICDDFIGILLTSVKYGSHSIVFVKEITRLCTVSIRKHPSMGVASKEPENVISRFLTYGR